MHIKVNVSSVWDTYHLDIHYVLEIELCLMTLNSIAQSRISSLVSRQILKNQII